MTQRTIAARAAPTLEHLTNAMITAATQDFRHPTRLLVLFAAIWLVLAIAPVFRQDWLLENLVVLITVPVLIMTRRTMPFSNGAYNALFVFLVLHEIGAHYTYAEVPYDRAWQSLFGFSLNDSLGFSRNHYDRLVHFLYGVLVIPAIVELYDVKAPPKGVWRFWLPVFFIMANSSLFELIEWAAAIVFGGALGQAYLGMQGDVWDAQQDMALASLGGLLTMCVIAWRRRVIGKW